MMTLTTDQITEIKRFINSRGFTHIEVEMEILDHVASAIEEKLDKDPQKTIQQAISEVHSGFGPLGFSVMEDEFKKGFGKLMKRELKSLLQSYLLGPKALYSLLIYAVFFLVGILVLPHLNNSALSLKLYYYSVGIIVSTIVLISNRKSSKRWHKKSFVMGTIAPYAIFAFTLGGQFFGVGTEIMMNNTGNSLSVVLFALFSAIIVLYGMIISELLQWGMAWTQERYLKYA
jgi:hypothetical protein